MILDFYQHNLVHVFEKKLYGLYPYQMAILENNASALTVKLIWYLNAPRNCRHDLMYAREVKAENQNVEPVLELQKYQT